MARGALTLRALPQATCALARAAHFAGYRSEFRALSVRSGNEETPESRKGVLLWNSHWRQRKQMSTSYRWSRGSSQSPPQILRMPSESILSSSVLASCTESDRVECTHAASCLSQSDIHLCSVPSDPEPVPRSRVRRYLSVSLKRSAC